MRLVFGRGFPRCRALYCGTAVVVVHDLILMLRILPREACVWPCFLPLQNSIVVQL